ncbi:GntR family transcriptional regulator [Desulfocucumis palustris]|uniref:GntR family transcriptional regulator n=1 Tax=Desulfocucumis palustris TaxID=1898651 RepID=UPI000CE9D9F1|nr:GntR family transcriptional regulator [Desulfocucumis palustris]
MALDIYSPIPLHVQLKEVLREEIEKGNYNEKIPSERELMDRFSVSRTTVREAVSALVRDGFLEKIHGKGTFITSHPVNEWLSNLRSFTETIEGMGMKPGIRLLSQKVKNNPKIAETLGVKEYYAIKRLRFANDEPIAIERTYYPVKIGLKLAEYDLNKVTLYTLLESIGIILYEAEQKITGTMPGEEDAKLLGISPATNVLAAERLTSDPRGNPLEYYYSVFRADKYAFCIKMFRKNRQILLR